LAGQNKDAHSTFKNREEVIPNEIFNYVCDVYCLLSWCRAGNGGIKYDFWIQPQI